MLEEIMAHIGASPMDYIIIGMGFPVVAFCGFLYLKIMKLFGKYHQLDKLILLICWMSELDLVKIHRNGDYEIKNPLNKPSD
jgi:hypothetical protein